MLQCMRLVCVHAVQAFDLLSSLLRYDHNERATAAEALAHEYFTPVRCVYVRVLLPVSGAAVADAVHDLLPFVPIGNIVFCGERRGRDAGHSPPTSNHHGLSSGSLRHLLAASASAADGDLPSLCPLL